MATPVLGRAGLVMVLVAAVYTGWRTALPVAGTAGCLGAAVTLAVRTGVERPVTLLVVVAVALVLALLRLGFTRRPRPRTGSGSSDG